MDITTPSRLAPIAPRANKATFHWTMACCGAFVVLMLAILAYVCSRPQTSDIEAAEANALSQCWKRSADGTRTEIYRSAARDSCKEMQKQYVHKFGSVRQP